jgi:hypothetical protein
MALDKMAAGKMLSRRNSMAPILSGQPLNSLDVQVMNKFMKPFRLRTWGNIHNTLYSSQLINWPNKL